MEGCSPHRLPRARQAWKIYVAVVFCVVVVVPAVVLTTMFCQLSADSAMAGNCSVRLEWLEEALAVTNRSLTEAHQQWEVCRNKLGELEGQASELEQALARVTQLEEENGKLKAAVAQQQNQLEDLESSRNELQLQNKHLQKELQDMRSQHSGGNRLPAASLSLLVLLLPGMLLL
ncbi:uncharacterized protein ACIBXB_019371 [Morphnus guianensis]